MNIEFDLKLFNEELIEDLASNCEHEDVCLILQFVMTNFWSANATLCFEMFYKGIILNSAKFVNAIIDACISSICIFLIFAYCDLVFCLKLKPIRV